MLAGGSSGAMLLDTGDRKQRSAAFFSGRLAVVMFCLDAMILLHRGFATSLRRVDGPLSLRRFKLFTANDCPNRINYLHSDCILIRTRTWTTSSHWLGHNHCTTDNTWLWNVFVSRLAGQWKRGRSPYSTPWKYVQQQIGIIRILSHTEGCYAAF